MWAFVGFRLVSKSTTYPSYPSPHPQRFPTFSPPCPISERSCSVNTFNSFMLMPASHPWVMKAFCTPISWEFEPFSQTTASSVSQMQQVYSPTNFWRPHSKTQTQLFVFLTQGKLTHPHGRKPQFFLFLKKNHIDGKILSYAGSYSRGRKKTLPDLPSEETFT